MTESEATAANPNLAGLDSVKSYSFAPGQSLPLVIEPVKEMDLIDWLAEHKAALEPLLLEHGGILFRNFPILGAADLQNCIQAFSGTPLQYVEQSSPRTAVEGNIYTSTDYPPEERIAMHCENSYRNAWPLRIFFHCVQPAGQGGETPIADVRKIYHRIDPQILRRFQEKKVMYVRNFGGGFGLPWEKVFQTQDKGEVEAFCRAGGLQAEWNGEQLRTRAVRDPVKKHPRSGEPVWFNHAVFFHVSSLKKEDRETLLELFEPEELPTNTFYGDGAAIEDSTAEHVRNAFEEETILFPWQKGDLLVLDNMLVAHGRMPYQGPRRILVGMAEPVSA